MWLVNVHILLYADDTMPSAEKSNKLQQMIGDRGNAARTTNMTTNLSETKT